MVGFFRMFLFVINKISFIGMLVIGLFAFITEIIGIPKAEIFLKKFNISFGFESVMLIGFIFTAIMIISYFLRKKLFD